MNNIELRKLAIKKLKNKKVQSIKKHLCNQFIDKKQKKECVIGFDKGFIKSFISSRKNHM
jgi:hypothetical protein